MTQTYKVQVSMNQAHIVESGFVWKQGDFGFNIEIEVLDFDTTGATPQIIFRKSTGAVEATQISVAGNKFTYAIRGTELDTPGPCVCDLKLNDSTTKRVSTASFKYFVIPDTMDGLEQEASSYSDTIEQLLSDVVHLSDTPGLVKNDGTINTTIETDVAEQENEINAINDKINNIEYFQNRALTGNHKLSEMVFKRVQSKSFYKNLQFIMNEMNFDWDFTNTNNGNLYPITVGGELTETIADNKWNIKNNTNNNKNVFRFFGKWYAFCSYEVAFKVINSAGYGAITGFLFQTKTNGVTIDFKTQGTQYVIEYQTFTRNGSQYINDPIVTSSAFTMPEDMKLDAIITFGYESVDIYLRNGKTITPIYGFNYVANIYDMNNIQNTDVWTYTRLGVNNEIEINTVNAHYDCGVAQADTRPIICKSGSPFIHDNKVYFSCSSRTKLDGYNTIISKTLDSGEWKLESVLLFQINRTIRIHSASSIVFDETKGIFYIWNVEFTDSHTMTFGTATCNLIAGLNIIGMNYMQGGITNDKQFKAKEGDEDPCLFYKQDEDMWYLSFCRFYQSEGTYRIFLFKSEDPLFNFEYVSMTTLTDATGSTITKIGGDYLLLFGASNKYYYCALDDLSEGSEIIQDIPTGGFRGWASIFAIPQGDNTKYGWITFDRVLKGAVGASYGNLYYYESDLYNNGNEFRIKLPF